MSITKTLLGPQLAWLSSFASEFKPGAPRTSSKIRPFSLLLKHMLSGVESRLSILVLYQLLWERCCLSTGELFPSSPQGWCTEVPLSPFHLVITLIPECPECSPLCHSPLLASLWLQLSHCPTNSYLLPLSRVTMSSSPSTFHNPSSPWLQYVNQPLLSFHIHFKIWMGET